MPTAIGYFMVVTLATAASCDGQVRDPAASDTTYQRRLAYQEQMSHKVPMDSLNHLYLRLADASPAEAGAIARAISCERTRTIVRHGATTYLIADRRAMDSLKKAQPAAYARAMDRFRNLDPSTTATGEADCHINGVVQAPDSLTFLPVPTGNARPRPTRP